MARILLTALLALMACATTAIGAETAAVLVATDPLTEIAPVPPLAEFAATHGIPLGGLSLAADGAAPRQGDHVTLLVTLFDGPVQQQWLAQIEADVLTAGEAGMKPLPDMVMYSGTGSTWHYPITRTALNVDFIGPFVAGMKRPPTEKRERVLTNPEYLSYGLDAYCRVEMRLRAAMKAAGIDKGGIASLTIPIPAAWLKDGQRIAKAVNFAPEEDRVRSGGWLPVTAFVQTALKIPTFGAVLEQVLDTPSIWSIIRHGGVNQDWDYRDFARVEAAGIAAPMEVYRFGLKIRMNETFSVKSAFVVTAPRPPLQAGAGILAIYAERPSDPTKRLFIRVLAAHRAGAP